MIDDQLNRHHRIDQGGVASLIGDRITQSGQIDQCGLAQDVVTDNPRRKPRKVEIALAFDELRKRRGEGGRIALSNEIFGQHTRGVGQSVVGAGADGFNGCACVEILEAGAGQGGAVWGRHGAGFYPIGPASAACSAVHRDRPAARCTDDHQAGVNIGSMLPSCAALNTTFTRCPIFRASRSQSVMLVSIVTPSSSLT